MSCTENDSGPFVVFFLPAIVGGLTLLLARRWANSQTNSVSSTAISRRRRIIKDPLVKRPQTFVNSKMLSQGTNSKKSISVPSKASCVLTGEEDNLQMAPGGRRLQRAARYSPAPIVNNTNAARTEPPAAFLNECPAAPKHIPFPNIPHDGDLLFEAMTFLLTTVAAGLQFLNLYRTVWWLPHSHTSQAMNFYLIDPHVVAFIVIILSRRLLLCVCASVLCSVTSPKYHPHALSALRMFVLGVVVGALAWCTYFIALKHPTINIFYLCYPATIYFLLFGAQVGPFLELGDHSGSRPPLHCCTSNPVSIRAEVEVLKLDFNMRMKKILFGSVMGAYYTGFIPCCFAQPYLYYDSYRATQHIALVWLGLFTGYAVQCYPAGYCDVLHRAALHLGGWTRLARPEGGEGGDAADSITGGSGVSWCSRTLWGEGARVLRPDGALFAARARVNAASPGDGSHYRFYAVFRNPSLLICCLLCLQLTLVLLQLSMLFGSAHWHHFLSISVLLFSNYYTLFKLVRDYLVSWKVYKAEYMIQDKSSTTVT